MKSLQEEFKRECRVCGGSGDILYFDGFKHQSKECKACDGTGVSRQWREMEKGLEAVFTCSNCGAQKVHYRLYGYRCPHRCEED